MHLIGFSETANNLAWWFISECIFEVSAKFDVNIFNFGSLTKLLIFLICDGE